MAQKLKTGVGRFSPWKEYPADPADWYSAEELDKAERYQGPLRKLRRIEWTVDRAIELAIIGFGLVPWLLDRLGIENWVAGVFVAIVVMVLAGQITGIPKSYWRELVYDKKWEFSNQTKKQWFADLLKGIPLGLVISSVLFIPIWWLIRTTDLWWLWGAVVLIVFAIVFATLFPVLIAPIFNKYTPLEEGSLREEIFEVARKVDADISDVLVEDSSKRDTRGNAYVAGLGKTRRVVVFDTMLENDRCELMSVVAHELGHWKLKHLRSRLPLIALMGLVSFLLLKFVLENEAVQDFAHVENIGDPGFLPVFMFAFPLISMLTGLVTSGLSRVHERQADLFAMESLGEGKSLAAGFGTMSRKYLLDIKPSWWQRMQGSHPPLAQRMAYCTAWHEEHATNRS
jgi:STE24 endopeptidase